MEKKKAIEFTQEQKSLIYNRFVAPANGTSEEAYHFIEYCEELGLNPLLGDVVFQKFETKYGPKTSFVTTRDGLLRIAVRDENYVGPPISNVVREGDHFEFLPAEGTVVHKFGNKRGNILGAYAVIYHKQFRPYACWADFGEYFTANANSQQGKSFIWDKYPSSMIEKVAETFALKKQFPVVGGLTTEEEIGQDINLPEQIKGVPNEGNNQSNQGEPKSDEQTQPVQETKPEPKREDKPAENEQPQEPARTEPVANEEQPETTESVKGEEVQIASVETGVSPSKVPFGKVNIVKNDGSKLLVLAKGKELTELVKPLQVGEKVVMEIEEQGDFHLIKGVATGVN
ncbi:RecT family recombinase [Ornithinibacillus contaminans]|uniref:RecT family recombinase n=1 Tax=Ornithinibacillus contaminans TaxID=694055 RepID=UPI00064DB724|nr:RecT family recombinase [Ornithinibacillus contaminans]